MKTLLISEIFPPKTGGSGRWFFELYSRLSLDKYIVAAGNDERAKEFDSNHHLRIVRWPLTIPKWGIIHPKRMLCYFALFRHLKALVISEGINTIHCGRAIPEGLLGWFAWKRVKIPYLCFVHGEELEIYNKSREITWLSHKVFSSANKIIVNSNNTRQLLMDYLPSLPKSKIHILHPGVDTEYFQPAPVDPDVRRKLGWQDRAVILTVGRLQKRKGHDYTILALEKIKEKIPNVLYAIVGEGEEKEYLKHLVNEKRLNQYVQFLGEINDDGIRRCYQQCDIFVLANREVNKDVEGFGIVLLEAQSCCKPVITGNSGGTSETVVPNETGLIVDCSKPVMLTDAIIQLLINDETRNAMAKKAREWVCDKFDWRSLVICTEELFKISNRDIKIY